MLTDATALASVTTIQGDLQFIGNVAFAGSVLGALTRVGGRLIYTAGPNDPVTSIPAIGGGIDVVGDLMLSGGLTSVAGLNVRRVGGSIWIDPGQLPVLGTYSLPSLVEGFIQFFFTVLQTCINRPPLVVDLPALTTGNWHFGGSSPRPPCLVDLLLPVRGGSADLSFVRNYSFGVTQTTGDVSFGAENNAPTPITELKVHGVTATNLHVGNIPRLTSMTLTGINVQGMTVRGSPLLAGMTVSGSVSAQIMFIDVPLMSDAQMVAVGMSLGAPAVYRSDNGSFPRRLFPP